MIDRRGFLKAMLAACAAPAIVRASSLMKVSSIIIPTTEEVFALNSLLTPSIIARESFLILERNLIASNRISRRFEQQFLDIGTSLK